jgi:hypothetical protein
MQEYPVTASARYVRTLSPFERMWIAAQTSCHLVKIEGKGNITVDQLRTAVERAARANPGSRLRLKGFGPWSHWEETDRLATVTEVDGSNWNGCGSEDAPFSDVVHMDHREGPSVSYILIRGETTRIVQRSHHGTLDGIGEHMLFKEVFRALRGDSLLSARSVETDLDLAKAMGGKSQKLTTECLNPFPQPSNGVSGSIWRCISLKGKIKKQPMQRCIMAIAEFARRNGEGQVLIDIPVNLRSEFPQIQSLGNLTGSLRLVIPPNATVESIADDIRSQLAAKRQANPIVSNAYVRFVPLSVMRRVAQSMARRAIASNRFSPSATVSNFGMIDLEELSCADFRAERCAFIAPAYDGVPLFLGLAGSANGLELSARAPVALASNGRLDALLEELGQMLTDVASS